MADGATIGIVVIYCLAMIGIGGWASRKIKNTEDYLVAGRSLGFWVFVLLMIGTVCSGMSLLESPGLDLNSDGRPSGNRYLFTLDSLLYHLLWSETACYYP
jgi:SSS family solute:Na+ symporter